MQVLLYMCESIPITALPEYGTTTFENAMTKTRDKNNFNIRFCSNNSTSSRWGNNTNCMLMLL